MAGRFVLLRRGEVRWVTFWLDGMVSIVTTGLVPEGSVAAGGVRLGMIRPCEFRFVRAGIS